MMAPLQHIFTILDERTLRQQNSEYSMTQQSWLLMLLIRSHGEPITFAQPRLLSLP